MFKVHFDKDYLKIQRKGNKTLAEITGTMDSPETLFIPNEIDEWFKSLPKANIQISASYGNKKTYTLHIYSKIIKDEGDIDDPALAAKLVESKAKTSLYGYLYTFCFKLLRYYNKILYNTIDVQYDRTICNLGGNHTTLEAAVNKYFNLYKKENYHFLELSKYIKNV